MVLATILAGNLATCTTAFAGIDEIDISNRGEATPINYIFDGKPFVNANVYANPGGSIEAGSEYQLRDFENDAEKEALAQGIRYWYGPLVNKVDISGSVAGKAAAIYISPNAYVENINISSGAQLEGAMLSDWSPTGIPRVLGSFVNAEGETESLDLAQEHIHLPEGKDGLTRLNFEGDNLANKGKIGSAMLEYGSFIMNVTSGSLNYEGTAEVDSVNVAKGAVLQGGTFKLDKEGIHRTEADKEDNGKLINRGMLSAALPKMKIPFCGLRAMWLMTAVLWALLLLVTMWVL